MKLTATVGGNPWQDWRSGKILEIKKIRLEVFFQRYLSPL
jgi:hypothetical protein